MKERVTLTIESDLLAQVDATIDKETVKNRSHAIELLLRNVLRGKAPKTAVILAGGKPTEETVKCMIDIGGKPVLEHNIELVRKYGATEIILAVGPGATTIKEHFGHGDAFGVRITYFEEETPLGTAGCLHALKERLNKPFIMLNGDELKNIDLAKFYEAHNSNNALATIALTTVKDPTGYGVAVLDGNNILRFEEKPGNAQTMLVNAGAYIIEPQVTAMVPQGFSMLEQDVFPKLARENKLYGFFFSGQWFDFEKPEDIGIAQKEWQSE